MHSRSSHVRHRVDACSVRGVRRREAGHKPSARWAKRNRHVRQRERHQCDAEPEQAVLEHAPSSDSRRTVLLDRVSTDVPESSTMKRMPIGSSSVPHALPEEQGEEMKKPVKNRRKLPKYAAIGAAASRRQRELKRRGDEGVRQRDEERTASGRRRAGTGRGARGARPAV